MIFQVVLVPQIIMDLIAKYNMVNVLLTNWIISFLIIYLLVPCDEYCTGGYCDDDDCHCDTKWEGKLCIGECEILEGGCLDCLSYDCGYCGITKSCITREYSDTCEEGYSETHCGI